MSKIHELLSLNVYRSCNGVTLMPAPSQKLPDVKNDMIATGATIAHFMQLAMSFWLLDQQGNTQIINQAGIDVCGFQSLDHALGRSLLAVSPKASASILLDNCHEVICKREYQIFDESLIRNDGKQYQFLSIKLPWYDRNENIMGVCGFSLALGIHALGSNLYLLNQLGIPNAINKPQPPIQLVIEDTIKKLVLPAREAQCLQLTVQGFTAKMIAHKLGLSYRTVEGYLNNLKTRLGKNSKTELVQYILASVFI